MEFGGGNTLEEIVSRLQGWYDRGGKELEDLGPGGVGAGSRWFRPPYPLQRTWAKLIRVALNAEGKSATNDSIRAYQSDSLGRAGGLDCIVELLPLPSPGLGRWNFYPDFARKYPQLWYLAKREAYTSHVAPARIARLQARILEHHPRAVIFYGSVYRHWWQQIAGVTFERSNLEKVQVAKNDHTLFISMQHPAAHGVTTSYFDAIGRMIAEAHLP
jgi:hypothetical protein